ncbi:MAG: rod-binding protein [Vulcanimicrobiaceae bacterium]|jgi:Rod binding domain-containing protein
MPIDPIAGASTKPLTPDQTAALANLHKVATQFEGLFVGMLLHQMDKDQPDDTIFGKRSPGEKIFSDMLDDQRAQSMASTGYFGIAKEIEGQMRSAVLANAGNEAKSSTKAGNL